MSQHGISDVITVPNLETLVATHANILSGRKPRWNRRRKPGKHIFYIQETDSYLAPTDSQQKWLRGSEINLKTFVEDLALLESVRQNGNQLLYTQFYFQDLKNTLTEKPLAVSLCHSEVHGEGSTVSMQVVVTKSAGMSGALNVDPAFKWAALSVNTGLSFENAVASSMSIRCNIPSGEVGQLFLSRTRKLTYTPWSRNLVYDVQAKSFVASDMPYERWPEESRIVAAGMGEWVCATSSKAQLQCHKVKGLSMLEIFQ